MNNVIAAIQQCEWLYLRSIEDPGNNTLRLVIEEARAVDKDKSRTLEIFGPVLGLEAVLRDARQIEHTEGCQVFELYWDSYVAYSVRNESYVANDPHEQSEGRLFLQYSTSRFLDYVELGTFATSEYPGPLVHWGVICANHVIDVVGTEAPFARNLRDDA